MSKDEDLAIIARAMRRARATQGALAILALLSAALWFMLWQNHALGTSPGTDLFSLALSAGSGCLAARFIAFYRRRLPIETSAAYRLLKDEPERVIWLFPQAVHLNIGPLRPAVEQVFIMLTGDGRAEKIHGVWSGSSAAVEGALRRLVPRARYGWSEKNRKFYQKHTGLLVK
jgi:hypothetical protein